MKNRYEMEDNREYEINILQSYLRRIFSCPRETWKIQPLRLKMVVKGVEIKCKKQEEENYILMNNVVQWNSNRQQNTNIRRKQRNQYIEN